MNRVWTEEELDILRRDREAKVPVPVTAAKLGRPVPATYARARLIGTLVQLHQSWDEASVARLRELVCADPPMTDKRIAAELGRTVTQIRWKMQDLGLIGVRDLSKLAKVTAAESARLKTSSARSAEPRPAMPAAEKRPPKQLEGKAVSAAPTIPIRVAKPQTIDPQVALNKALNDLETIMAERLKSSIAETEAGMIKAARAAIAEKGRIDQRLVVRVKRAADAEARRQAAAKQAEVEAGKAEAETKRKAEEDARQVREQCLREKIEPASSKSLKMLGPVEKKPLSSVVRGISQVAPRSPAPLPAAPSVPKIVVTEAPAAMKPAEADRVSSSISGRGGWKSVRRDPGRILAQAKAKAKPANRADAVDLAQAAQAAIERFIAERGVTRTESDGVQAVVSRLQARGYIVVRDETGWMIDQRHHIGCESDLMAFAEARGITLSAAA